ncbi:hypothetical protein QLQ15_06670 [Lysobacter sp. LF1]|uniref:Uncharacterized protein n=1 Tax=Lysobacter stagni TaxID=3045172 RepID=A0ABT6XEM2_9GAMM|nr:hypothetical protein [Lysobacter sp. LF1]MDI9238597.1 hypothetical protein [Lysobacter sp. LF1]
MNIYTGLLFQQGYIQDPALALSLSDEQAQGERVEEVAATQAPEPRRERRGVCATFHSHAVSMVCGATALSPFR